MARIIPDGWHEPESSDAAARTGLAGARRHHETLTLLAAGLPDDYTVYHAVHWTNVERGWSVFGEIDFVVVNRAGAMLLIEQKTGFLEEGPDGLLKRERGRIRNVPAQMARTVATLREKLSRRPGAEGVVVDYLLYCPDHSVRRVEGAGVSADRLIDASRRDRLVPTIRAILPPAAAAAAAQQVDRFLRDVIELETDVNALVGQAQAMVTRISGGLAHWARQLDFSPFRLHVDGTAGSGKTQLALAEFRDAIERGNRPLYVCYNRPLADHFCAIVPPGGEVFTFHTLCQRLLADAGRSPDFSGPEAFTRMEIEAARVPVTERWRFDTVIVDEGQDFPEAWRDQVLRHAREDSRVVWLEDRYQALYGREPARLPGWVTLHARTNYRSPREVVRLLHAILPSEVRIEAAGPLAEADIELLTHADAQGPLGMTKEAIRKCLAAGFRRSDIAVISFRGREKSVLTSLEQLGPHQLKTFAGRYDLLGQPVYRDGELLVESVYRFKGQAAPAVVLTEVDFEKLDDMTVRKLFVGATRATMKLVIVATERAGAVLRLRLAEAGAAPD
jgi:hypothetical protein